MTLILYTLVLLAYFIVLKRRNAACKKYAIECTKWRSAIAELVKKPMDAKLKDVILVTLKGIRSSIHLGPSNKASSNGIKSAPVEKWLSIDSVLREQLDGQLDAIVTALISTGRLGEIQMRLARQVAYAQDRLFLALLLIPFALQLARVFGSTGINKNFMLAFLLIAFAIWTGLRYWIGNINQILAHMELDLDALRCYALQSVDDRTQRDAANDLIYHLSNSVHTIGEKMARLDSTIAQTPEKLSEKIEARLIERGTLTESLNAMSRQGKAMEAAITVHASAVKQLPEQLYQALSREVSGGLEPTRKSVENLAENLAKSYKAISHGLEHTSVQLVQAIRCFSDGDQLQAWLQHLKQATNGIQDLGVRIDRHFENAQSSAHALHKIAASVSSLQEGIGKELVELNKLNQYRGVEEKLWADKMLISFHTNLENIEKEHRTFRIIIDSFIQKVDQDAGIRESLHNELPSLMSRLREVSDAMKTTVEKAEGMPELYAEVMQKIAETSANNESRLHGIMHEMSKEFQKQQHSHHQKIVEETGKTVQALTNLAIRHEQSASMRVEALEKSEKLFLTELANQSAESRKTLATWFDKTRAAQSEQSHQSALAYQNLLDKFGEASYKQTEQLLKNMTAMGLGMSKLSDQARDWDQMIKRIGEDQRLAGEQLAINLGMALKGEVNKLVVEIIKQAEAVNNKNRAHESDLEKLIFVTQKQAERLDQLSNSFVTHVENLKKPNMLKKVEVICILGIFIMVLFRVLMIM